MYRKRMNDYYPQVIQSIVDYQAIIDAEYPEIEALAEGRDRVLNDAYLLTMGEERITEWEAVLGIKPLADSSIEDRRETIIARIRGQGKLNTSLINSIVKTFTGGTANSWIENSTLYIEITPPPENKSFKFANVEQELSRKVPAHLGFNVSRSYREWVDVVNTYATWQDVKETFETWNDVFLGISLK